MLVSTNAGDSPLETCCETFTIDIGRRLAASYYRTIGSQGGKIYVSQCTYSCRHRALKPILFKGSDTCVYKGRDDVSVDPWEEEVKYRLLHLPKLTISPISEGIVPRIRFLCI